jgi:tagatose 1,6-diphosphate aldolase
MKLSVGKLRGLSSTASETGVFTVLAFDHRQSFVKMIKTGDGQMASYDQIVAVKSAVVKALAPHASAVLLDPVYSAAQSITSRVLPPQTGLLVALEKSGYAGNTSARVSRLLNGWSVEKIKRMGADAVKLLIYYHPDAVGLAQRQELLVRRVANDCRRYDIAFFLEAVSYSIDPQVDKTSAHFAEERPELIRRIASRLSALEPEVLKLEFPVDVHHVADERNWARACEAVSEASKVPWAVLSAGVDFDLFKRQVEVACRSGASGFIGGRAVWKEGIPMMPAEREKWLRTVATARLDQLAEIAERYALPWWKPIEGREQKVSQDWFKFYPGFG